MPPDRRPRCGKGQRFLPADPEQRRAELKREEEAIRRQIGTWGLDIKPAAEAGKGKP